MGCEPPPGGGSPGAGSSSNLGFTPLMTRSARSLLPTASNSSRDSGMGTGGSGGGSQPIRIGPLPKELITNHRTLHSDAGAAAVLEVARRTLSPTQVELIEQALLKGSSSSGGNAASGGGGGGGSSRKIRDSSHSRRSNNSSGHHPTNASDHSSRLTNPQQHSDSSLYFPNDDLSLGSGHTSNHSRHSVGRTSSRNSNASNDGEPMPPMPVQQQQQHYQQQQQLQRMAELQSMEHVVLRDVPTGMDALCSTGGGGRSGTGPDHGRMFG